MYNSDELIPPEFLNNAFFKNILQTYLNDTTISISKLNFQPASKIGDHFGSIMFKVRVAYEQVNKNSNMDVVIKTAPIEEGFKKNLLNYKKTFADEVEIYTNVVTKMEKLLSDHQDYTKIAPKLLYHSIEPYLVIVMEDITAQGFLLPTDLLEFENTKTVLSMLAKFHAASMVLNERIYSLTHIKNSFFHIGETDFQIATNIILPNIKLYNESIKYREGFEKISQHLEIFADQFLDKLHFVYKNTEKKTIKALCHADFHIKNIMLRNSHDVLMFDYQVCVWGTPAIDLYYVFYQIANLNTRVHYREEIQKHYYQVLVQTLNRLHYIQKIPTYEQLQNELRINVDAEIMQIICFYKYRFMDWSNVEIEKQLAKDPDFMTKMVYNNLDYLNITKKELERCMDMKKF